MDHGAILADDAPHVRGMQPQLKHRLTVLLARGEADRLGLAHEALDDKIEERLHGGRKGVQAAAVAAASRVAFRMKLATVSLGWAPLLTQ